MKIIPINIKPRFDEYQIVQNIRATIHAANDMMKIMKLDDPKVGEIIDHAYSILATSSETLPLQFRINNEPSDVMVSRNYVKTNNLYEPILANTYHRSNNESYPMDMIIKLENGVEWKELMLTLGYMGNDIYLNGTKGEYLFVTVNINSFYLKPTKFVPRPYEQFMNDAIGHLNREDIDTVQKVLSKIFYGICTMDRTVLKFGTDFTFQHDLVKFFEEPNYANVIYPQYYLGNNTYILDTVKEDRDRFERLESIEMVYPRRFYPISILLPINNDHKDKFVPELRSLGVRIESLPRLYYIHDNEQINLGDEILYIQAPAYKMKEICKYSFVNHAPEIRYLLNGIKNAINLQYKV